MSDDEGAMAEPLSVALHAVRRAGPLLGKRVLVTGCGPIGALVVIAARRAGATHIVVTDVGAHPLRKALKVGADEAINVAEEPERLARFTADKGSFDVLFEASGNERALRGAFDALRPRGIIVQVGLGGDMTLPINTIVAKEFDLRGAFRFHEEFAVAVELLNKRLVDVKPLISATLPYRDAGARLCAGGRSLAGDMEKIFDVAALGEAMLEFNQTQAGQPQYLQGFGGDTSNAVIAAARAGARTTYLTRLGAGHLRRRAAGAVAARRASTHRASSATRRAHRHLLRHARPQGPRVQLSARRAPPPAA